MIGKLLGMLTSLVAAVCVATVIAAVVLVSYYAQSWKVTKERAGQAMAILQGTSPEALLPPLPPKKQDQSEQPAYEELLAKHDLNRLDLDKREQSLRAMLRQFQDQLDTIETEKKRVKAVSEELQAQIDTMRSGAKTAGMEDVQQTIQTLKPKQAKDLIKQQLDKGEVDVVARMLRSMSESKRAKIIAEFKSADDMKQISDVLERIREGQPDTELADETAKKIQPPKGPGT